MATKIRKTEKKKWASRPLQPLVSPLETEALNCLCELVGSPPGCGTARQIPITTTDRIEIIKRYLQQAYDQGKRANAGDKV
jgi:hypothetical protein